MNFTESISLKKKNATPAREAGRAQNVESVEGGKSREEGKRETRLQKWLHLRRSCANVKPLL